MAHILEGLVGAVLGAVLFLAITYWVGGEPNWTFAFVLMAICFVLGAAVGRRFLEWMRNIIEHVW